MSDSLWGSVSIPPLTASEIQIWRIGLNNALATEAAFLDGLSTEEGKRAGRLREGPVRMQFLAGRYWLRRLLGAALGVSPEAVSLTANEYGKPELLPTATVDLHFNVAHSRSTVLVAIGCSGPIGIDVEYQDRDTEVLEVARHALTERETQGLMAIDDILLRRQAFFRCWTRKEAVIKADGRGMYLPLTSFEVPLDETCQAVPIDIASVSGDAQRRYFVSDIALEQGVAGAIAVADQPIAHRLYSLSDVGFGLPK